MTKTSLNFEELRNWWWLVSSIVILVAFFVSIKQDLSYLKEAFESHLQANVVTDQRLADHEKRIIILEQR